MTVFERLSQFVGISSNKKEITLSNRRYTAPALLCRLSAIRSGKSIRRTLDFESGLSLGGNPSRRNRLMRNPVPIIVSGILSALIPAGVIGITIG